MRGGEKKKKIVNQIFWSKLWFRGQILLFQNISKRKLKKKNIQFSLEQQKIRPPTQLAQSYGGLGILDIDTQLNCINKKWIQWLLNSTNVLWKDLMLYWLELILNFHQGLALFRQKQIHRSTSHKNLPKQNHESFFIHLLYAWKYLTTNSVPAPCL